MRSDIDSKLHESLIQWNWRHTKGNQDSHSGPLYKWEKLNFECYQSAKERWYLDQDPTQQPAPKNKLGNDFWRLYSDVTITATSKQEHNQGIKISTKLSYSIYIPPPPYCTSRTRYTILMKTAII